MPPRTHKSSPKAGILAIAAALLVTNIPLPAQENAKSPKKPKYETICVLPESYEMRPDIFVLAPGARRVGFTLFRETSTGLEPYTRSELRSSSLTWHQCFLLGRDTATRHLATLKHQIVRDQRKIVQYARFTSENPLTASILISPDLLKRFEDTLGKELYVAIPDRYNVFVFPKLSDSIEKVTPKMSYLHKEALYPVSREVFELSKEGIRVVGKF